MRHPIVLCCAVLCEGNATLRLDGFQPKRAVSGGSGQDDANRTMPPFFGQRTKELIDRTMHPVAFARQQLQCVTRHDHAPGGRDHVHMIWLDRQLILNFRDRHFRGPRQNLRQSTGVGRCQVLHQNVRHSRIARQRFKQLRERLQPARRRANADNRE